jgi:7-cyano-7-deazaguanine synthase
VSKYAIAIVSGGLDSTTLVYHLLAEGYEVDCLSFDYGQRHKKELEYAKRTAMQLGLVHDVVDLSGLTHLISNSALTSDQRKVPYMGDLSVPRIEVPDGHYAEDNMKLTVVPNRNMIMLSIAIGVAINRKATTVAAGMHAGDHFIYPDCRPDFIEAMRQAAWIGNEGFHNFEIEHLPYAGRRTNAIIAPFIDKTKADIAYRALDLNVPLHMTWSCYKGGEKHCGRCGTCVERLEAIEEAAVQFKGMSQAVFSDVDQTEYEDTEYWRTAVREAKEKANG